MARDERRFEGEIAPIVYFIVVYCGVDDLIVLFMKSARRGASAHEMGAMWRYLLGRVMDSTLLEASRYVGPRMYINI